MGPNRNDVSFEALAKEEVNIGYERSVVLSKKRAGIIQLFLRN
jgi:hypothetical protein